MTKLEDMRKTFEATLGNLTPARAQELAKGFLEPGARKEQVAKTAADLVEWSQRNRERLRTAIRREISDQMQQMGVATRSELDAVKKRVRDLERAAGMTASGRSAAAKSPRSARKPATAKPSSASSASTAKPSSASTASTAKRTPTRPTSERGERGTPTG